jgi:multiple sugar transport system substrate-binding protein
MEKYKISRRSLLKGLAALGVTAAVAGCGPKATPEPTEEAPEAETEVVPVEEEPELTVPEGACDNHDVFVPLLPTDTEATMSFWDSCESAPINEFYDELNLKFKEFYPNVTLDLQHGQSAENFVAACAAGTPPDVWSCGWNPERIGIWAYNGCLLALDDYIAAVDFPMDRWIPGCNGTVEMDGKIWGLPIGVGMYMTWYNPKHLDEVGAEYPQDTDELWAIADELTTYDDDGNIQRLGMRLTDWFWSHMTWICNFGGRIWDLEKDEPTPDHPGVLAALNDMVEAVERYGVDNLDRWSSSIGGQGGVQQPYFTSDLSMMIEGDWYLQQIDEMHPDWEPGDQFGIEAAPFAPESKQGGDPAVSLWVWPIAMSKESKEPDMAWEFLRWRASKERAVTGAMTTRDLISTECYLEDPRVDWESAKVILRFLESGKQGISPLPCTPISGEYSDLIGAAVDEIIHLAITPEEAMARVKEEALALYEEYR